AKICTDDISSERAGAKLEPALPKLRKELGASASDEDLLLAAFYDRTLLEPLSAARTPYRFSTTPLLELVRYVESRRDVRHARIRTSGAEISLSA
ncbi:MAG TPA: hypothetical protein VIM34_04010, partial [Burkholderiaceae bacterium]